MGEAHKKSYKKIINRIKYLLFIFNFLVSPINAAFCHEPSWTNLTSVGNSLVNEGLLLWLFEQFFKYIFRDIMHIPTQCSRSFKFAKMCMH